MKVTAIKQQVKQSGRYSIFIDEIYAFSLSESALLESKLITGQVVTREEIAAFKKLSADDKLYTAALRYVALRLRTTWEVESYLQRKGASPALVKYILNKLSELDLLDDEKYARAYLHDRQLLRPASRRKIIAGLRQKRIPNEIIEKAVQPDQLAEQAALQQVIEQKRRQPKYQDDKRLLQYLARQGFSYEDIKTALQRTVA